MYDAAIGRWNAVDPLSEEYLSYSPYHYVMNNPVILFDLDGASTYIDEDGNVIAVYDDDNTGVFQVNSADIDFNYATFEGQGDLTFDENGKPVEFKERKRLSGGEQVGETEHWDEFRGHNNETGEVTNDVQGRIMVGKSWDISLMLLNNESMSIGLERTAVESTPKGDFDIKVNKSYAPYGPSTGKLLNGKYATARSAGNYLAGMNAASSTNASGLYVKKDAFMKLAGQLHSPRNTQGAPYYGEIPYAGRMIESGWNEGMQIRYEMIKRKLKK